MPIILMIILIGAICFVARMIVLIFQGIAKIFPILICIIIGIMILLSIAH